MRVSFMHPKGPARPENSFFWPTKEDICHIPGGHFLKIENFDFITQF